MTSLDGRSLEERMADTIDPFKEELARLTEGRTKEVERHRRAMADLDSDIAKLKRVLKALDVDVEEKSTKQRRHGSGGPRIGVRRTINGEHPTGFGVTVEGARPYVEKILEMAGRDGTVTQKAVWKALDADQSIASQVFRFLRHIEFLRKAGRGSTGADHWAVQDADALDRYMWSLREEEAAQIVQLRNASADSEDEFERVTAYIRDHSPVKGWVEIERALDIDDAKIKSMGDSLKGAGLITVTGQGRGKRVLIEWVRDLKAVAA